MMLKPHSGSKSERFVCAWYLVMDGWRADVFFQHSRATKQATPAAKTFPSLEPQVSAYHMLTEKGLEPDEQAYGTISVERARWLQHQSKIYEHRLHAHNCTTRKPILRMILVVKYC